MNNTSHNTHSGERLSFFQLFTEKNFHVEIPIIQRDYAQGRSSSSEIRELFLDALYKYLEENKPNRDLDFVYGSLVNNENTRFVPLDGQQRLTTLFLLHWYLANISDNIKDFRKALTKNEENYYKSKFTYETRTSSREFCDVLMANEIDMNQLLEEDSDKKNSLSKTIQDCYWFYFSWEFDPTIQSMLTMLDAIHLKFSDKPEFYSRLIDKDNPVITFFFLNLDEFKLSDDLYIKMNARGKPLTIFENFKAKFEQHIDEKLNWDSTDQRKLILGGKEHEVNPKVYFSHKIDTCWANLFWHYRNLHTNDDSFDDELMNFIRIIVSNEYAGNNKTDKDPTLEYLIGTQVAKKRSDYTDKITYHIYEHLLKGVLTKNAVSYLIEALDALTNGNDKIQTHLDDTFYFHEQQLFEKTLKHELTLPQRVQVHAYLKFLIYNKGNNEGLFQWMRVVHNLTENTIIDGADEVARAIKSVENLLPHSNNILEYLKTSNHQIEFFLGRQVQEERIKAHLIPKPTEWKDAIETIEKHTYFKGQIAFLLEYSGILAFYEEHSNCKWQTEQEKSYFDKFRNYSEKAAVVFRAIDPASKNSSANLDYLWERAVLSKGDYLIEASAYRWNFLSTNRNMRDFSWKRLLRLPPMGSNVAANWKEKRAFVKEVFDDVNFNTGDIKESLTNICKTLPNDWRRYFIDNPELIRYCEQGFIRYESDSKILLFKQSQRNHRHRELYTYKLYLCLKEQWNKDLFMPFAKRKYWEVKSSDDYACIVIYDWQYKKNDFAIDIYFEDDDKDFLINPYQIRFYISENTNKIDDFPEEVTSVLESLNFGWKDNDSYTGYWISEKTEDDVVDLLKKLCGELERLNESIPKRGNQ